MREEVTRERLEAFLHAWGTSAREDASVYLVGGATAVAYGWRTSTIDIDLRLAPERDDLLRALPNLKDRMAINVELASPDQFIPVRDGWNDRSRFAGRYGKLTVYHYDLYAQALAKVERGHTRDLSDVRAMLERGLVLAARLLEEYVAIEPLLYRFPAIDPPSFRRAVLDVLGPFGDGGRARPT